MSRKVLIGAVVLLAMGLLALQFFGGGETVAGVSMSAPAQGSRAPEAPEAPEAPAEFAAMRTTNGETFARNLDSRIASLEARVAADTENLDDRPSLAGLLRTRGMFRGNIHDIQRASELLTEHLTRFPSDVGALLGRAATHQTLHRFREAERDLESAQELGATELQTRVLVSELQWNAGEYDEAIAAIRAIAADRPGPRSMARLAVLEHSLGNFAAGDLAFRRAEAAVTSTEPLPVAWLYVQWAISRMHVGRWPEAAEILREAVRRLPSYVLAEEHLAECLHQLGQSEEAVALYEDVMETSADPEFAGALSDVLQDLGRTDEAARLRQTAKEGFDAQTEEFPEAMFAHASAFYLEHDEARRALELLEQNVALRPNSEAYRQLAEAQLEVGEVDAARLSIGRALAMPQVSQDLFAAAEAVYTAAEDPTALRAVEARASEMATRLAATQ